MHCLFLLSTTRSMSLPLPISTASIRHQGGGFQSILKATKSNGLDIVHSGDCHSWSAHLLSICGSSKLYYRRRINAHGTCM